MFNQVGLMGRITREPEIKFLQSTNNSVIRFSVAVERDYKTAGEERPKADFINCVAWNKMAEFISKNFAKGSMIMLTGRIETGSYDNANGGKTYTTEVNVSKAYFTGERRGQQAAEQPQPSGDGFMDIPDGIDADIPFM